MKSKMIVINLERRKDRRENVENQLASMKIENYSFFRAIDGKELKSDNYIYNLFLGNDFNWRKGVIGCALSHYNIWNSLLNSEDDYYCILEDDIVLSNDFNNSLSKCDSFIEKNECDFLLLGYHMFRQNKEKYSKIYTSNSSNTSVSFLPYRSDLYIGGFFGYIITKSGAHKILKYIEENRIKHGIDYLIKIDKSLKIYECQPMIIHSDWVETSISNVDSDIQKDYNSMSFNIFDMYKMVQINNCRYKYYQGLDSSGNDLGFAGNLNLTELSNLAENNAGCVAFNSLGFLKSAVSEIKPSPYIHPINHGLYVKIIENHVDPNRKIRVKMMCNWCTSQQLCLEWNHMSQGNFTWNNIEITYTNVNIDYYVIINRPPGNEYYVPEKTIIFHMEPWCYSPDQNWGIKTWGEWAKPDPEKFLQVRSHDKYINNGMWQLKQTYTEFKTQPIVKDNKYGDIISTICSSKYFDPGHIKRIDFLKYVETRNDPLVTIHVYNHDNNHRFKNYQGPHPPGNKDAGITPYKYYFMGENNEEHNFITEKIWEPLLTESLCFYWGCPNISDYINPLAFVLLDLSDFEKSFNIIKDAISNNLWEQRIDIIREEKQKVLDYYNFFPTLERIIEENRCVFPVSLKPIKSICFIHSCNLPNYGTRVLDELYDEIVNSGLLDQLDYLVINNIGIKIDKQHIKHEKVRIINHSTDTSSFELSTINKILAFSSVHPDCKLLYLHTKGISHANPNVTDWRRYLSYFMISKHEECMKHLDTYDAVGCNYLTSPHKHFSGNFWWANTNYIKTLDKTVLKIKHDAEWWILSNSNNFYTIRNSNINHYHLPYPPSMYSD